MLTITLSARALAVVFAAAAALLGLYATHTLVSGSGPDQFIQGDVDCDGDVDTGDVLATLRHIGGLDVLQNEGCPQIATVGAIPGPAGPAGPPGPQGEPGPPGTNLFAHVTDAGVLEIGTAVSASRDSTGNFVVTFGQDVSQCAAVAMPGTHDGGATSIGARAYTDVHSDTPQDVTVSFRKGPSDPVDTDFHLIVVC